jgi:intracellular multiplication protein IcmT
MQENFRPDTHWRDSARTARFWIFDAPACFPVLLALLHIRWWTFGLAIFAVLFFTLLNRRGFTVVVFFRWLRTFLAGPVKKAKPWWIK